MSNFIDLATMGWAYYVLMLSGETNVGKLVFWGAAMGASFVTLEIRAMKGKS
jgi:hypothetical protein